MAMEKQFVITDTHPRTITAIGFHPIRREIVVGFEGNKVFNAEVKKLLENYELKDIVFESIHR